MMRVEWRAVGYDTPENAWDGDERPSHTHGKRHLYEYGEWQDDREAAEADLAEMRASEVPYDYSWLERREVTVTEPERIVDPATSVPQGAGDGVLADKHAEALEAVADWLSCMNCVENADVHALRRIAEGLREAQR